MVMEEKDLTSVDPTPLFRAPLPLRMQALDDIELLSPSPSQPSVSSCQQVYTPQVKDEVIPKITQQFDNLEKVRKFYNSYALEAGFSIQINSSKTNKDGETIRKEYVCYKEGARKNPTPTRRKKGV
ncbi:hypothetical protein RHMOL_Rhmol01G0122300 [Rhododendron molle]|uniref:Uncharacterized protein n=1 Tax=Rhododendron molle TaxID=49168 RepID=A0ACC0Q253_RHOML|nr:hypothetical protein RHMOL_Rhmol01G0122300 [Rhododendron molle]